MVTVVALIHMEWTLGRAVISVGPSVLMCKIHWFCDLLGLFQFLSHGFPLWAPWLSWNDPGISKSWEYILLKNRYLKGLLNISPYHKTWWSLNITPVAPSFCPLRKRDPEGTTATLFSCLSFIGLWLFYSVVWASDLQQSESAIHTHLSILFFFPYGLSQNTK